MAAKHTSFTTFHNIDNNLDSNQGLTSFGKAHDSLIRQDRLADHHTVVVVFILKKNDRKA